MTKTEELKAGLASVGIGWIEPTDLRNKAGLFMLHHGVKMGVPVDPADVQSMLVKFATHECLGIYITATNMAQKACQVVGEKNDYYVTLQQLEKLLSNK